jgi:hypothetical protein
MNDSGMKLMEVMTRDLNDNQKKEISYIRKAGDLERLFFYGSIAGGLGAVATGFVNQDQHLMLAGLAGLILGTGGVVRTSITDQNREIYTKLHKISNQIEYSRENTLGVTGHLVNSTNTQNKRG